LILILSVCGAQNENFVGIENLKCEYLNNPKGIEKAQPYLSWEIKGRGESNSSESSYRVNCLFLLGGTSTEVKTSSDNFRFCIVVVI